VGLSALPDAGSAGGSGDEEGAAAAADPSAEVSGEAEACAHRDLPSEVDVPLGPCRVCGEGLVCEAEEDADALPCDALRLPVGHGVPQPFLLFGGV